MHRGDVYKFENHTDYKFMRVLRCEMRDHEDDGSSALLLIGNVMTDDLEVHKSVSFLMSSFIEMVVDKKAYIADDADAAMLFLTDSKF